MGNLTVVTFRFFFIPIESLTLGIFFTRLLTYFVTTLISAALMKYALKIKNHHLELIHALSSALDYRDAYTMNHSLDVAYYAVRIAEQMKLPKGSIDIIHTGALLHDIGKIGIPEQILMKNGKLTVEEYKTIQTHPEIGFKMLSHVGAYRENGVLDIVLHHHERYDGTGYPKGLKGKEIPLYARIVAVSDAFDAMTSERVYGDKCDIEASLKELEKNRNTQFDPLVVDAFLRAFDGKHQMEINGKPVTRSV